MSFHMGKASMDKSKIDNIVAWKVPHSLKELRGFLGLSGYYERFIKGYGLIAQPLSKLLEKGNWHWSSQALKTALTSTHILVLPDFDEVFCIDTNASSTSVGGHFTTERTTNCLF
ncbi:Retrovirus-related Pol polyprotein from transposon 297 family [Gossypium australe]|uniref:Retrovirus-related Pol polyprotein from transposon 297 family n=1 Tax=Gossypium australe TaxID=47621 RepID=A0A5B6W0G9_9ROSI|nr:Retrovirus-related Pol polyprotein from transposon 297 family [Gossypium australe]